MGVKMLGARVRRIEDPRLLRGQGAFVDDLQLPGLLHMAVLRSPHAHARIRQVRTDAARQLPGVVDVFTLDAFGDQPPSFPVLLPPPDAKPAPQFPLAADRVRYVGEGIAVVLAENLSIAHDALGLIEVDFFDVLQPVASVDAATAEGAPQLHAGIAGNRYAEWTIERGDVDSAFAQAEIVIREQLSMQRYSGVPLETRGVLASHDQVTDDLVIWASTQWPHTARSLTAALLGIPEQRVRVSAPDVGGGFGVKVEFYPEDLLVPFAARRCGRPVKWIETRREHMLSTVHARQQVHHIELALRRDGTIVGLRDRILTDMGAYVRALGFINPSLASASVPGPYNIPNVRIDSLAVLTNKTPVSPYRGAGQPEATFARERILDIAARELGMDPAELRRKNLLQPDALPYDVGLASVEGPVVYDSGNYPKALQVALDSIDYAAIRREQRAAANGRLLGVGLAVYAQISGNGPFESAEVRVDSAGKVTLVSGVAAIGQGIGTTLAQVVAEELGVNLEDIQVICGDTTRIPFGVGTFASRAAVMGGTATAMACQAVRDKAVQLAAHLLEVHVEDVEWADGQARVRGAPANAVTLAQLAQAASPGGNRPPGMEPSLEARRYFETHASPYSYGVHAVVAEVDADTGAVKVVRYAVANDAGVLINPTIVEGQIAGGIAQGLGGAILEELAYDADGQLITSTLMDYALPSASDVPGIQFAHLETPTPHNPLGIKGLGEGGAIASHAAVANAVADAVAGLGARVTETPLRAEAVFELMQRARQPRD